MAEQGAAAGAMPSAGQSSAGASAAGGTGARAAGGGTGEASADAALFKEKVEYAVTCWTNAGAFPHRSFTRNAYLAQFLALPEPVKKAARAALKDSASPPRKKQRSSGPQQTRPWPRLSWIGDTDAMCPRRHRYWGMRDRNHFDMVAEDAEQFCGSAGTALAAGKFAFDQSQVLERGIKETVRYLYMMNGGKLNQPGKELCFRWTWHWKNVNCFTRLETARRTLRADLLELRYHVALAKKARRECRRAVEEQPRLAAAVAAATAHATATARATAPLQSRVHELFAEALAARCEDPSEFWGARAKGWCRGCAKELSVSLMFHAHLCEQCVRRDIKQAVVKEHKQRVRLQNKEAKTAAAEARTAAADLHHRSRRDWMLGLYHAREACLRATIMIRRCYKMAIALEIGARECLQIIPSNETARGWLAKSEHIVRECADVAKEILSHEPDERNARSAMMPVFRKSQYVRGNKYGWD